MHNKTQMNKFRIFFGTFALFLLSLMILSDMRSLRWTADIQGAGESPVLDMQNAVAVRKDPAQHAAAPADADTPLARRAARLQARLERDGFHYPLSVLVDALVQRSAFMSRSLTVNFPATNGDTFASLPVSIGAFPLWLKPIRGANEFSFLLDTKTIQQTMAESVGASLPSPVDSTIVSIDDSGGVMRAVTDHPAEPGYVFNAAAAAETLMTALKGSGSGLDIPVIFSPGKIINATGKDLGPLNYLASGRSNFAGSGGGRISNVRLGLNTYINNVIVPPGATFSFNDALNNLRPISQWKDALVIMNGKDLVPIPGGGVCQVATTVYRGVLYAGLPVTERVSHSLFVTYYEKYGVGIDATVFPGKQDFTFLNDTGNYLLLQAYTKDFEAAVHLYGVPDGRSVTLAGPFFSTNTTEQTQTLLGTKLRGNEIGWLQTIRFADGSEKINPILSRYLSIPKRLYAEYTQPGARSL
jgi:vancomycin resistance protein YoaR